MSNMGCLFGAVSLLMTMRVKYNKICDDPERKAQTSYFGAYSIITSILCTGLFLLCFWGILACADALDGGGLAVLVIYAFIAVLILMALILLAELIFGGLMGFIYQRKCNKRPIGWIALAVLIVCVAGMVVGLLFIAGAL